ncbi:MAG: hypothetical protein U9R27_11920 [Campylobacterota bacterium]|nr:hypothetical protein [Campylobacterota bacterium]
MKRLILSAGVLTAFLFGSVASDEIDKMVVLIKARREGIALKELSSTLNPFVTLKKDINETKVYVPEKKDDKIILNGIVNNKAYINGKWHKEGDEIAGYTLKHIGTKGVVLADDSRVKKVFLRKKSEGIIMMKEGK